MPKRYFLNSLAKSDKRLDSTFVKNKVVQLSGLILQKFSASQRNCDGGLYVGLGGAAYSLWYASHKSAFVSEREKFLSSGANLIKYHIGYAEKSRRKEDDVAFLLGNGGVFMTGALIFREVGDRKEVDRLLERYSAAASTLLPVNYLSCGGDELLVGRAGYLFGILNLRFEIATAQYIFGGSIALLDLWVPTQIYGTHKSTGLKLGESVIPEETVIKIIRSMLESGRRYAKARRSPCPLMYAYYDTEYLGAAHGLAGILQALISFPAELRKADPRAEADVKESIDFFLKIQQTNGNFPCAMDELGGRRSSEDELIHWCHGAPGTIFLFARAYHLWKDAKYLEACIRCGSVIWEKGLLKKGPGVCHGIGGNGYAFLLLYQLTQEEKYLNMAHSFAEFMETEEFKKGARTPDSPYSLYEGLSGTMCFYIDLLDPKNAEFPLSPVFF